MFHGIATKLQGYIVTKHVILSLFQSSNQQDDTIFYKKASLKKSLDIYDF